MEILGCFLLAVCVSIDSLGIGLSYGIRKIVIPISAKIIVSLISMILTFLGLWFGTVFANILNPNISKLVGIIMLIFLGIFIIYQSLNQEKIKDKHYGILIDWFIKPLGITVKIVRDPIESDINKSNYIEFKEALYLGFAISLDSFAVGFSSAIAGFNVIFVPIFTGLFQFLFLSIGVLIGKKLVKLGLNSKVLTLSSGIILIAMAIGRFYF